MHRPLSGLLAIVIFSVCLPVKASLVFSFSFENNLDGTASGPISGRILGLVDDRTEQSATNVILDSAVGYPNVLALPIDFVVSPNWQVTESNNKFTVEDGRITFASFYAECGVSEFTCPEGTAEGDFLFLSDPDAEVGGLFDVIFLGEGNSNFSTVSTTVVFSAVDQSTPVSSPATLALLGLGLLGLRLRRK